MKKRITLFILYITYWYVLFIFTRIAFLLSYLGKTVKLPVSEIFGTFSHGFKLDMGIVAYIAFLPSIVLTFSSFFKGRFIKYFFHFYTLLVLFFCSAIILGDLFMYQHWGFRLDATPLFYMSNLKAMTASVSTFTVIGGVFGVLFLTALLYFVYLKFFNPILNSLKKDTRTFYVLLPLTLMLIIVMRGGIGISSLTTSSAYFSKNQFANHAAINPIWNVGFSITESNDLNRKYEYFTENEVNKILLPLQQKEGTKISLLNSDRPNIILFITESLTAKALQATGGRADILPQLNQLVKEGVLFNHIYAASDRTDKGIAAVLSGYPSLPGSSPLKYQKLTQKLAFVPQKLNAVGYTCELYYGGTLDFANYRSYVVQAGYDKLVSDKDFPPSDLKSKWGAFDDVVFSRCLADTPNGDEKFFKTIITLTSHEPFETPVVPVFPGTDTESKYLNSLHYTDQSIGEFIKVAKTRDWWKNTLVIIIADHGSRLPGNSENYEASKYHIPMIWLGGALNVRDTVIQNLASQTDLAATLLSQLNIRSDEFKFSKNILTSSFIPYSFFTFTDGFGFYKPDNLLIYNTVTNTYSSAAAGKDSISEMQGKAYLQSLYMDFYKKNN